MRKTNYIDGNAVKRLRLDQGLSQNQLAAAAGLQPGDLAQIESPRRHPYIHIRTVFRIAEQLGASPSALLDEPSPTRTPDSETLLNEGVEGNPEAWMRLSLAILLSAHPSPVPVVALADALGLTVEKLDRWLRHPPDLEASHGLVITQRDDRVFLSSSVSTPLTDHFVARAQLAQRVLPTQVRLIMLIRRGALQRQVQPLLHANRNRELLRAGVLEVAETGVVQAAPDVLAVDQILNEIRDITAGPRLGREHESSPTG